MTTFVTGQDLSNEIEIITYVCEKWKTDYHKLPKWDLDFMLHRDGNAVAFAEVKKSTKSFMQYPTQFISLQKINHLRRSQEYLESVLIYAYTDGIYYIKIDDIRGNVVYRGRNPRPGSTNDMEWC